MRRNQLDRRYVLAAVIGIAAALLAWQLPGRLGAGSQSAAELKAVHLFEPAREIPDFSLSQSDGTRLVKGELKGHWTLVFLGFTHCPDICPTTLAQMARAQKVWETLPEASRPRVLFVSVDPERDSPDQVGDYAHGFHKDTLAATGNIPALEQFAQSLSMIFKKMPVEPGVPADQYTVDHTASLALLDPQARMSGVLSPPYDVDQVAQDLMQLSKKH